MMPAVHATGSAAEAARMLCLLRHNSDWGVPGASAYSPAATRNTAHSTSAEAERWDLLESIAERLRQPRPNREVCLRLLQHLASGGGEACSASGSIH